MACMQEGGSEGDFVRFFLHKSRPLIISFLSQSEAGQGRAVLKGQQSGQVACAGFLRRYNVNKMMIN